MRPRRAQAQCAAHMPHMRRSCAIVAMCCAVFFPLRGKLAVARLREVNLPAGQREAGLGHLYPTKARAKGAATFAGAPVLFAARSACAQWGRWSRVAANYVGVLPPDVGSFAAAPFPQVSTALKHLPLSWGPENPFSVLRLFAAFPYSGRRIVR